MSTILKTFLSMYHLLTPKQRQIFKYLQWQCKNRIACFPSLETIAKFANCGIRTVSRTIAYFKKMNYLVWFRRYNQSNNYYMDDQLVHVDLDNPETFSMTKEMKEFFSHEDGNHVVQQDGKQDGQLLSIPIAHPNGTCTSKNSSVPQIDSSLREIPLPLKDKLSLTHWFKPFQLAQAVEDYFWYLSKGKTVKTPFGFLISQAKKAWG